jgi:hypothetical protein
VGLRTSFYIILNLILKNATLESAVQIYICLYILKSYNLGWEETFFLDIFCHKDNRIIFAFVQPAGGVSMMTETKVNFLKTIGPGLGSPGGLIRFPCGISTDESSNIYVALAAGWIDKLDQQGKFLMAIGLGEGK